MLIISACQIQPIGMSDSSFSASSSSVGNEASKAQLDSISAWSPSTDRNADDYLQIDLQHEYFICAVATRGDPKWHHWTTKYKLLLSLNNTDYITYKENGADKVKITLCFIIRLNCWPMMKRSILIGSLSVQYFVIQIAQMEHS